ncbi:hypothetical protein CFOL_v3_12369 [Cephalotus follicularis]|uniref:Uncharacterized protein n=1 Tax=Cephalotus follicularis TaxID=3775 RepID=A0A1Q3BLG3_CEPFO|nr:hypothetical protein CFOL_v3_12369 [Cephalotus follicularis]
MKLSAKPISSPGRAEKYPPPLMRFLRSNVGSRSRGTGRSRSSPMFVRKKSTAIETQEPSSPKVTCMGQVRVRRSKQAGSIRPGKKPGAPIRKRRCKWIQTALICDRFGWKHKPKSFTPTLRKWVLFFHMGFRKKSKGRQDLSRFESKFGNKSEDFEQRNEEEDNVEEEEEEEEEAEVFVSTSSSPPKNALLLMRCRSAPYRSSSLASRFWGSPLTNEETEQKQISKQEEENPTLDNETICKDWSQESRMDQEIDEEKLGFLEDSNLIKDKFLKSANVVSIPEVKITGDATVRPLILTRCKSEPARTAENKLDPDLTFINRRRLGFT